MPTLFEPVRIGQLFLKNRLVAAAMNSVMAETGGYVSDRMLNHYARRASGGVGLVVVADGGVDLGHVNSHPQLRLADDSFTPGLTRLADAIKRNGASAAIQLQHAGWRTSRAVGLAQAVGPTSLTSRELGEPTRALTATEIREIVREFGRAAKRAKQAGFDAVEIHGAHGYLVSLFLSPLTNWRQDDYGGDVRRRSRFALEIAEEVRHSVGPEYPVIFRISASEFVEGGLELEDATIICCWLVKAGVDCISVSAGTEGLSSRCVPCMLLPRGILVPLAATIKKAVPVPVIAVGRIDTPSLAEEIVRDGKADLVAMGRPLLADPDLPRKAQEGRQDEIRKCIYCNSCRRDPPPEGLPIRCLMNPEIGLEGLTEQRAEVARRILVLGIGPAALEAARVARLRGHDVEVWEESASIGGRWSWLIRGFVAEYLQTFRKLGIRLRLSCTTTPRAVLESGADVAIVTSRAVRPQLDVSFAPGEAIIWADDILDRGQPAKGTVVVVGNNNIALEVTYGLVRRQMHVIMVGSSDAPGMGLDPNTAVVLIERLHEAGLDYRSGLRPKAIQESRLLCLDNLGVGHAVRGDSFVVTQRLQPSDDFASELGDCGMEVRILPYCDQPGYVMRGIRMGASVARQI